LLCGSLPLVEEPAYFVKRVGMDKKLYVGFVEGVGMGKKLYVGNLGYGVSSSDLETMFTAHGTVQSAQVIVDRDTGRSKGFGFVEMGSDQEAQAAIAALNGKDTNGRALKVNEAKPREGGQRGGRGSRY